jgi:hypothetical protein
LLVGGEERGRRGIRNDEWRMAKSGGDEAQRPGVQLRGWDLSWALNCRGEANYFEKKQN